MKKILLALFLVVAIGLNLAGCSVGGDNSSLGGSGAVSSGTGESSGAASSKPEEKKLNYDMLNDLNKTLEELEKKYGAAKWCMDPEDPELYSSTCFFEGISGYHMFVELNEQGLTDIITENRPPKPHAVYFGYDGKVSDLFLGFKEAMTIEEFEKAYGVDFEISSGFGTQHYWYEHKDGGYCEVTIEFKEEWIVKPETHLMMGHSKTKW